MAESPITQATSARQNDASAPASPDDDGDWPKPAQSWYAVGVLIVVYLVALVDRQILTLLVQPIRRDLGLTDTQLSLLIGLAFAAFYTILGVPIARLADRRPRRTIIAVGVFFWSVATVACGIAQNYWQLFLARVGVGVGEATLQPSAYSMLADYFPPQKLGRAIGTYASGLFLGGGLALIVGGAVIKALSGTESVVLPVFGEVRAWQVAFIIVGAPGVLLTLVLMATVAEPPRRGLRRAAGDPVDATRLTPFMRENARTLGAIFGAFSLGGIAVVGYLAWIPELVRRSYGWDIADVGFVFGLQMAVFGTAGTLFGGWYVDRLARRGHKDAAMRASILAFALLVPLVVLPPLMPTAALGVTLLAPLMFVIGMQQGYSPVALQLIAPNEIRAQVVAVFFLVAQICALGFGPTAIALVTDYGFGRDEALRWSMSIVGGACCALALALLVWGLPAYVKSVQRAELWLGRGAPPQAGGSAER
jgi:MFS family permease